MLTKFVSVFFLVLTSMSVYSVEPNINMPIATDQAISDDLSLILEKAGLESDLISFEAYRYDTDQYISQIQCESGKVKIRVWASGYEWSATFYHALQKLGFLFPHPRMQISPTKSQILSKCGKRYVWKPRLKFRGFHLHTLHPSEWVSGFIQGKTAIAKDTIRWFARNGQNTFQFAMLRGRLSTLARNLRESYAFAKEMGVARGLSAGFALQQQNSYKLVNIIPSTTGVNDRSQLRRRLTDLIEKIDFDFMTLELGTSEFTSVNFKRQLQWMNDASDILGKDGKQLFIKVHISSNQYHPEYGNFNFLPQFAHQEVGILPHTVFFYSLEDRQAPMYENGNFVQMGQFMRQEKSSRPTWYYPETSYYIGMDIDIPLLLTPYLNTRKTDFDYLDRYGVEGQINFTTGQEVGYWLMDWTTALLNNKDYKDNAMIALDLLGEERSVWSRIFRFQEKHFRNNQVIQMVTTSNFQDEMPFLGKIHERHLLRELDKNKSLNRVEMGKLANALNEMPSTDGIKNEELRTLMEVTHLRIRHAYYLRKALQYERRRDPMRREAIGQAKLVREDALEKMSIIKEKYNRYPESKVFERWRNPTSYPTGYGKDATDLFFWKREEEMVRRKRYSPFFMGRIGMLLNILL